MNRYGHHLESAYSGVVLPTDDGLYIRLLELVSDPSADDDTPISCNLRVISLDHAMKRDAYIALSYMWGTEDASRRVLLNGKAVRVRQNLWDFLRQSRRDQQRRARRLKRQKRNRAGDAKINYFWIDALCINQSDTLERNRQVALMGQIYTHASSVLIWLGASKGGLKKSLDTLETLQLNPAERFDSRMRNVGELMPFAYNQYWSRAWIVQECVLARKLQIRCGSRKTRERCLRKLYAYLKAIELHIWYSPVYRVLKARTKWHDAAGRLYFELCDDQDPRSECSDARDRIYSKVAIMDPSKNIVPDYNKSAIELFTELADHQVPWNQHRAVRLLLLAYNLDLVESVSWEHVENSAAVVSNKAKEAEEFVRSGKTKEEFLARRKPDQRHRQTGSNKQTSFALTFG
jgi:hypothetical protein